MGADFRIDTIVHYYEAGRGPFKSLSVLERGEAESVLARFRQEGKVFAGKRPADYLDTRHSLEERIRHLFVAKGGRPKLLHPHYFILGQCEWVKSWYQAGQAISIPLHRVVPTAISFTYGDSFPAMRYQDGKPYRGQVFTLQELPALLAQYGLPQIWNPEGLLGPDRYIEAQLWDDEPILNFLEMHA